MDRFQRILLAAGILIISLGVIDMGFNMFVPKPKATTHGKVLEVDMGSEVLGPEEYTWINTKLREATPCDTIVFKLHNYGGRIDGMIYLLNAIASSDANVVMHVDGNSFSAAAVLACAGDKLIVEPNTFLMFHGPSYNGDIYIGKVSDALSYLTATQKQFRNTLQQCIDKDILTEEQADAIVNGQEIYVFPDVLKKSSIYWTE